MLPDYGMHRFRFSKTLMFLLPLAVAGCIQNTPYRTGGVEDRCYDSPESCRQALIEQYLEFDLGFIEFTERGNLYDRTRSQLVMEFVDRQARSTEGAAVFVFVHGWKHNASYNDSNVVQFREMLSLAAENPFVGQRKVIGLYLGWRGDVTAAPGVREFSYWGRKSVAEEVGSGGVTEVLSELRQILIEQFKGDSANEPLYKNTFVIIGHSFGGAMVLSAVHDVMLSNLIAAYYSGKHNGNEYCGKIKRFADGVILINPAIEANRAILLREAAARCRFSDEQPKLMHVISSEADIATTRYFPIGQYVNITSTLGPKKLQREINGKSVILDERKLDHTTVGNLDQLRTAYLHFDQEQQQWSFKDCTRSMEDCGLAGTSKQRQHIPVDENDPLSFIRTDANFIKGHNDVFSCHMQAYITTVMFETQAADKGYLAQPGTSDGAPQREFAVAPNCNYRDFNFARCFSNQLDDYYCESF